MRLPFANTAASLGTKTRQRWTFESPQVICPFYLAQFAHSSKRRRAGNAGI